METNDRLVEVGDLEPVAYFEEDFVLFIDCEDENVPESLCVQADFAALRFDPVLPLGVYLESKPFLPLLDVDARISQRQRILDEMNVEVIDAMLQEFNQRKQLIWEGIVPLSEMYPGWQPGG